MPCKSRRGTARVSSTKYGHWRGGHSTGVSWPNLSRLLNGHISMTAEMSIRIGLLTGTTPELWLYNQVQWDLWRESQKPAPKIEPLQLLMAALFVSQWKQLNLINHPPAARMPLTRNWRLSILFQTFSSGKNATSTNPSVTKSAWRKAMALNVFPSADKRSLR